MATLTEDAVKEYGKLLYKALGDIKSNGKFVSESRVLGDALLIYLEAKKQVKDLNE